jgi:hypothetical protein
MPPKTIQEWFQQEWSAGRLTRPQNALTQLLHGPEAFIRKHPIVNTFDCAAHGPTNAYIRNDSADAQRPGSILGTKRLHKTESFNIELISGANANGFAFPVHGVYTSLSGGGPVWYTLNASGPAIMLTAKLTGCTFIATGGTGNAVLVTHLQPQQGLETGLQLNTRMKNVGSTYGQLRYDLDTRSINVIGVRSGNTWSIWAQKLVKNSTPPQILSVHKIWPV